MEAGVSVETVQSTRSPGESTKILIRSIWHWIAGFHAPVVAASDQQSAKAYEQSGKTDEPTAVADPKTKVRPAGQISSGIPSALDEGEIQRRRSLVRIFFNDFWSGSYEKPAGFLQRLDQAEDYVNDRLADNGEAWRLDTQTRVMLGLPPRANSAGAP
jgi:hypothetical protein